MVCFLIRGYENEEDLSFVTMNWETTWIVWPIAGVLFAVVMGAAKLCIRK